MKHSKICLQKKKYFAIHSVGLANHETKKKRGECDFILITDMGILCLEVKGSYTVTYTKKADRQDIENPKHDLWDYGGDMVKQESPFDQCRGRSRGCTQNFRKVKTKKKQIYHWSRSDFY